MRYNIFLVILATQEDISIVEGQASACVVGRRVMLAFLKLIRVKVTMSIET